MSWSLLANTIKAKATTDAIDTTGADLLIVEVVSYSVTPITVSDSKSNTWSYGTEKAVGTCHTRLAYCQGGTVGSAHTFSTNANFYTIAVAAFSGSAASPFDVENGNAGTSPIATGSITPSADGELIISAAGESADGATGSQVYSNNASLSITNQEPAISGNVDGGALAWLAQSTKTSINPTWSGSSGTPSLAVVIAAFKGAAGGGGTTVTATSALETWSGKGASLNAQTNVAASSGLETWSGKSATVASNTNVAASAALETWSGKASTVAALTNISASSALETWSGKAATVNVSGPIVISANSAIETWSGLASTVSAGGVVSAPRNRVFRSKKHVIYGG